MTIVPPHIITDEIKKLIVGIVALWDSLEPEQREQAQRELRNIMHPDEIEKLAALAAQQKGE